MNMIVSTFFSFLCYVMVLGNPNSTELSPEDVINGLKNTRRILNGQTAGETRPYMVYLRPATGITVNDPTWLCGGTIIHEKHILTSAACIEDVHLFVVVSGTHRWTPHNETNECIEKGSKRAVWKCVPHNYVYDGNEFDNIRWMIDDMAVVKVEEPFNFEKRIKGCDFIPKKVAYNNKSEDMEKSGTLGSTAGWGTTDKFGSIPSPYFDRLDSASKAPHVATTNSDVLLETEVKLITKKHCRMRWPERYHYIIDSYMVCGKNTETNLMSTDCAEREVDCKELEYTDNDEKETPEEIEKQHNQPPDFSHQARRRMMMVPDPEQFMVAPFHHNETRRKFGRAARLGGFCENDHGGPLIVGQGKTATVIGVITACLVKKSRKCYGPFLYSSVYKNRHLISCAIDKEMGTTCMKLLRSMQTSMKETFFDWSKRSRDEINDSLMKKPYG